MHSSSHAPHTSPSRWRTRQALRRTLAILTVLSAIAILVLPHLTTRALDSAPALEISLPENITKLHINIGPNTSPLTPPKESPKTGVLAVEPNVGIAHYLRERHQKTLHPSRFFVIACAIGGPPLAGGLATFRHYNLGVSSSLAPARRDALGRLPGFAKTGDDARGAGEFGPGEGGIDFVPVLSLEALLKAVPSRVEVEMLKTDAQGFDLSVVMSARRETLRRVGRIVSETYLPGVAERRYSGVRNELYRDWMPYMGQVGFRLVNEVHGSDKEFDATWERVG